MNKKSTGYKKNGLEFDGLEFSSKAEKAYVKRKVEDVAKKLKQLREAKGLSQEELAELVSASVATIKFIEQKQRAPSLPMLYKILFVLDRDLSVF